MGRKNGESGQRGRGWTAGAAAKAAGLGAALLLAGCGDFVPGAGSDGGPGDDRASGAEDAAPARPAPPPPPPMPAPPPPPPAMSETAPDAGMDEIVVTGTRMADADADADADARAMDRASSEAESEAVPPPRVPEPEPAPEPEPLPQSGQLTAGDYDDVLNPDLYELYLSRTLQEEPNLRDMPFVDAADRIAIRVSDRLGKPVPRAGLAVRTAGGDIAFPLRTGADGRAWLYPRFDGLEAGMDVQLAPDPNHAAETLEITSELLSQGGELGFSTPSDRQAVGALDLLITLDATGSMGDEMRYLQSELDAIMGRVEGELPGLDIRYALVAYRDEGDAFVVRETPFTDDLDAFGEALGALSAQGGGDFPEAMDQALEAGTGLAWRPEAVQINLLVADAPPHSDRIEASWNQALLARTEGRHIVPLAASGTDGTAEFLMRAMAQMTDGRYLFLTEDSGIGGAKAEPDVDCYVVTRLDQLVERVVVSLVTGERREPEGRDVIRTVGDYRQGVCDVSADEVEPVQVRGEQARD